eukprot:724698-Pleurochrysis_carterae.AAC.3
MPKPTASGSEVYLRTRLMKSPRSTGSAERAPVTPVRDTQYMNELATEASCAAKTAIRGWARGSSELWRRGESGRMSVGLGGWIGARGGG